MIKFSNKVLLVGLGLFLNMNCHAQVHCIANYKLIVNDKANGKRLEFYTLYLNAQRSIQFLSKANELQSNDGIEKVTDISVIKGLKEKFIFKDFGNKRLVLSENIFSKQFLVEDTLGSMKWKILSDKRIINNLKCRKAITSFRGRNYIAWYTDELPVRDGPWKFCGLPGLIVNIYDDNLVFNYELTNINIKSTFDDKILSIPKSYSKISLIRQSVFIANWSRKISDYKKMSRINQSNGNYTISDLSIALPEKQEKF